MAIPTKFNGTTIIKPSVWGFSPRARPEAEPILALLNFLQKLGLRFLVPSDDAAYNDVALRCISIERLLEARLKKYIGHKDSPELRKVITNEEILARKEWLASRTR